MGRAAQASPRSCCSALPADFRPHDPPTRCPAHAIHTAWLPHPYSSSAVPLSCMSRWGRRAGGATVTAPRPLSCGPNKPSGLRSPRHTATAECAGKYNCPVSSSVYHEINDYAPGAEATLTYKSGAAVSGCQHRRSGCRVTRLSRLCPPSSSAPASKPAGTAAAHRPSLPGTGHLVISADPRARARFPGPGKRR